MSDLPKCTCGPGKCCALHCKYTEFYDPLFPAATDMYADTINTEEDENERKQWEDMNAAWSRRAFSKYVKEMAEVVI